MIHWELKHTLLCLPAHHLKSLKENFMRMHRITVFRLMLFSISLSLKNGEQVAFVLYLWLADTPAV